MWVRVQLAVGGGGGGSFAWLLEEPALELDELEGLCIRKMKAIVIMNLARHAAHGECELALPLTLVNKAGHAREGHVDAVRAAIISRAAERARTS